MSAPTASVALRCHPDTPMPAVRGIDARAWLAADGRLCLAFGLDGDTAELRIPPPQAPAGPTDGLWRHTCFEAFVALAGAARYHEFNFSPSGQWAAYAFRAYRVRDDVAGESAAPALQVRRDTDRLELSACIPTAALPRSAAGGRLDVALTAVIEDADGARSYWAPHHPPGRPDFHHRDGFALTLVTGEAAAHTIR
jgi:hypothetical protein